MVEQAHNIDRILEAARALLVERGVRSISYRAVAQRLSMSPGTVAYYFSSRQQLLEAVLDRHHDRFAALTEPVLSMGPVELHAAVQKVRVLVRFAFASRADIRLRLAAWIERWALSDRRRTVMDQMLHASAAAYGASTWSEWERRIAMQALVFSTQIFAASSAEDLRAITGAATEDEARELVVETISRMSERLFGEDGTPSPKSPSRTPTRP